MTEPTSEQRQIAQAVVDWMMEQKFQGQEILHAIVCCDIVSHKRFVNEVAKVIAGAAPAPSEPAKPREAVPQAPDGTGMASFAEDTVVPSVQYDGATHEFYRSVEPLRASTDPEMLEEGIDRTAALKRMTEPAAAGGTAEDAFDGWCVRSVKAGEPTPSLKDAFLAGERRGRASRDGDFEALHSANLILAENVKKQAAEVQKAASELAELRELLREADENMGAYSWYERSNLAAKIRAALGRGEG